MSETAIPPSTETAATAVGARERHATSCFRRQHLCAHAAG